MKHELFLEPASARRASIRRLGYDPEQLTIEEQKELIDLERCLHARGERRPPRMMVLA